MTIQGQLLDMLESVAVALGSELRKKLVFVGGCSTGLLITDPITLQEVRATDDVDLIVDLAGKVEWMKLQEQLRDKGFSVSSEDGLICRMRLGDLKVDFMPDDEKILGFSNRWYAKGIGTAAKYTLPGGLEIKCLRSPFFVATKFEAYLGRGDNNPLESHDLEDILLIVDGRNELVAEVENADDDVRSFVAEQFRLLSEHQDFEHFLDGNIKGPEGRVEITHARIQALTEAGLN